MSMTKCNTCGGTVQWKQEGKRWNCFNLDGTSHWDRCSERRWNQVKTTGTPFSNKTGTGFANSVHGTKYSMKLEKKVIKPTDLSLPICACTTPPWEHCEHTVIAGMMPAQPKRKAA